jgi:hypothetical protein
MFYKLEPQQKNAAATNQAAFAGIALTGLF